MTSTRRNDSGCAFGAMHREDASDVSIARRRFGRRLRHRDRSRKRLQHRVEVADDATEAHEDHVFRDVRAVVGDALQVLGD